MLQTVLLNGTWQMKRVGDDGWSPAAVPGSVFRDLLEQKRIPDPFYRDNEAIVKEWARYDYIYRRTFAVSPSLLCCRSVQLICEGIDTLARIRINGVQVAQVDNMHRTYVFEVQPLLKEGENQIEITMFSPLNYIEQRQKEKPIWGCADALPGFPYLRKGHFMFGWDWGPVLPDLGIWRGIRLVGCEHARLEDVIVWQHHHADGSVTLEVESTCAALDATDLSVTVSLTAPDGAVRTQAVSGGEIATFQIENPQLWWPNGYGDQPLYTITAALSADGVPEDSRMLRVGLRRIRVVREPDRWGESFYFEINGCSIFAMGADYIPEDNLLTRVTPEKTRRLLADSALAGFNCVRVWGGGVYPDNAFYDACDELGLLVWQDFMFACATYDFTAEFEENITREAEDNIRRIRHHACLALWCGNNEMESGFELWGVPLNDEMKQNYLKQYEVVLKEAVRRYDPQTFYWPSSPSSGGGFQNPTDETRGDVHYWDVWHGLKPFSDYRKHYFRFVSEFGFQSFPCLRTVEGFTRPEDRNIFSYVMEQHQKNGSANGRILSYLSENFKYPQRFGDLLYVSQILQAEAIRCGVLHWRAHRGRCMGAIYWQLNDCWPVASWAGIDSEGRWKALHYYARRFFARRAAYAALDGACACFYVLNETGEALLGELRWALRDHASHLMREGCVSVAAPAFSAAQVCEADFSDLLASPDARRSAYIEYTLSAGGETLSTDTDVFVPEKHFAYLDPQIDVSVQCSGGKSVIRLRSQAYARHVEVEIDGIDAVFSDNYFDLSASQEKQIEVLRPADAVFSAADVHLRTVYHAGLPLEE